MPIPITRITSHQTRYSKKERYWRFWSEAYTSPIAVFEHELADAHWLEDEAKKLRSLMLWMSEEQEKTLDVPVIIEVRDDDYQVARVVKGPEASQLHDAAERDWIAEIAAQIQERVAELQTTIQSQQARIDELENEVADKQSRIDELAARIQAQQAWIAALENEADQAKAENLPSAPPAESVSSMAELAGFENQEYDSPNAAAIFYPVDTAVPVEDVNDLPIPPRHPEAESQKEAPPEIRAEGLMHPDGMQVLCYEANMDLTVNPKRLEVLSTFIELCKDGQYLNYSQSGLSRGHVYSLFEAGMLERSAETSYELRPSAAGETWYCQHTEKQAETPEQDKPPVKESREIHTEGLMHPDGTQVLRHEANMDLAPNPEYIEVLLAFIESCEDGQYLNYSQADFSQAQILHTSRLFGEGMLERSVTASYKMRPSAAGETWYHQHTASQTEVPEPKIAIDSSKVEQIRKESEEIQDIFLFEDDDDSEQDEQAQEDGFADGKADDQAAVDIPDELTDHTELVSIIGASQSDAARLIAVMMKNDWECALDTLEAAFKGEFVNVIIDDINERAYEEIGDSLIVEEGDQWVIDEGYRDEIEYILNRSDYRGQIADSPLKENLFEEPVLSADPWVAFAGQLQNYQREALAAISSGIYAESSLQAIAMREYLSVDDIIYQVNELAEEHLGDSLIENDGFLTPIIVKEAQQRLKYILWGINREMNEGEDDEENT